LIYIIGKTFLSSCSFCLFWGCVYVCVTHTHTCTLCAKNCPTFILL